MTSRGLHALVVIGVLLCAVAPALADSIVRTSDVEGDIASAHTVLLSAYTLSPRSRLLRELDAAASRGARVTLILTGSGMGYAVRQNREIAASGHRFRIVLTREPLHLKCVVLDGRSVYLSDRNFARRSLVLHLPDDYAPAVAQAALGRARNYRGLTVTKGSSLRAEAALIDEARRSVALATESFGVDNPVATALAHAMQRGVRVRISANEREVSPEGAVLLQTLARCGAIVTDSNADDKIAVADGRIAWIGSSNATSGLRQQTDWGYTSTTPALVTTATQRLDSDARGSAR